MLQLFLVSLQKDPSLARLRVDFSLIPKDAHAKAIALLQLRSAQLYQLHKDRTQYQLIVPLSPLGLSYQQWYLQAFWLESYLNSSLQSKGIPMTPQNPPHQPAGFGLKPYRNALHISINTLCIALADLTKPETHRDPDLATRIQLTMINPLKTLAYPTISASVRHEPHKILTFLTFLSAWKDLYPQLPASLNQTISYLIGSFFHLKEWYKLLNIQMGKIHDKALIDGQELTWYHTVYRIFNSPSVVSACPRAFHHLPVFWSLNLLLISARGERSLQALIQAEILKRIGDALTALREQPLKAEQVMSMSIAISALEQLQFEIPRAPQFLTRPKAPMLSALPFQWRTPDSIACEVQLRPIGGTFQCSHPWESRPYDYQPINQFITFPILSWTKFHALCVLEYERRQPGLSVEQVMKAREALDRQFTNACMPLLLQHTILEHFDGLLDLSRSASDRIQSLFSVARSLLAPLTINCTGPLFQIILSYGLSLLAYSKNLPDNAPPDPQLEPLAHQLHNIVNASDDFHLRAYPMLLVETILQIRFAYVFLMAQPAVLQDSWFAPTVKRLSDTYTSLIGSVQMPTHAEQIQKDLEAARRLFLPQMPHSYDAGEASAGSLSSDLDTLLATLADDNNLLTETDMPALLQTIDPLFFQGPSAPEAFPSLSPLQEFPASLDSPLTAGEAPQPTSSPSTSSHQRLRFGLNSN